MVAVFVALAELLRDFGLSTSALSNKNLSAQTASNMFWLNATQGLLAFVVIACLSPICADLFDQPILVQLQPVLALNLLINGFQIQFQVNLARNGRIWALALTDVAAPLLALAAGVISFVSGFGFWALAVQNIVSPAILALLRFWLSSWKPSAPRRIPKSDSFLKHSWRYGTGQLISYLMRNVDNLMVGLLWGPSNLGIYARAYQLQTLPLVGALAPLTTVVVPRLVDGNSHKTNSTRDLHKLQFIVGALGALGFSLLGSTAPIFLPWLLGDNWAGSAKIFLILSIAGIFESLSVVNYWRFLYESQSSKFLTANLISGTFGILNVIVSSFFGLYYVAVAVVINQITHWFISVTIQKKYLKETNLKFGKQGIYLAVIGLMTLTCSYFLQVVLLDNGVNLILTLISQVFLVVAMMIGLASLSKESRPYVLEFSHYFKTKHNQSKETISH
jgi:PST family polysaccharide transporter